MKFDPEMADLREEEKSLIITNDYQKCSLFTHSLFRSDGGLAKGTSLSIASQFKIYSIPYERAGGGLSGVSVPPLLVPGLGGLPATCWHVICEL